MAAVLEQKPDPAEKFDTQVDEQIAQATSRIRTHDLALGGLTLAAMAAVYATAAIVLDKYLNLPEWARQAGLAGFLAAAAAVGYFLVARPLRRRINPLYAAARVEDTIEDNKNSVTGYVEAQEKGGVSAAVRTAMSARAARAVGGADVNQAVNHRNLLVAGGVLVLFLAALAVLFFVFRPAQFASLVGRAFVPFSSDPIATRTQLTLVKPDPVDPTISTGQTVTVAVHVGGKVPPAGDPATRVRLLVRHNPADPQYDELPMQEGETTRDWQLKVPEYLVQNGFWYKVAAGDAETAEHKVSVRSLPMFTDYEVRYEYPKYTRIPPARRTDPNLMAYPGTAVTLTARANREVKDGQMRFEAATLPPVLAAPLSDRPDALRFRLTVTEATRYRLHLTAANGEKNVDPPPFAVALESDQPPRVEITAPEGAETTAPANGLLAVDGTISDDFGIDKYRLRLRVGDRDLAPVYPGDGAPKSLRREKDGTWPTDLAASGGFKLSADLTKLTFDSGAPFEPKENDAVEWWVEAIDNCTETKPIEGWGGEKPQPGNVGRSDVRKLRLTAPKVEPEDKEPLDRRKDQRQNAEKQHHAQQQKKLDDEKRDPPPPQDGQPQPKTEDKQGGEGGQPEPKKGDAKPEAGKDGDPNRKTETTDPKTGGPGGADPQKKEGPKDPEAKTPPDGPGPKTPPAAKDGKKEDGKKDAGGSAGTDTKTEPKPPAKPDADPKGGMQNTGPGGMNNTDPPQTAPPPKTPEDKQAEKDAERVRNELDKNKGPGGDAKPNPTTKPEDRTDPAQSKPQPKDMKGGDQDSAPKEAPKPADPRATPDGGKDPASEAKPQGNLEKPTDPAQPKPAPDAKADPAESRDAPLGGGAGQDKPEPKKGETPPAPKDPKGPQQDPTSGSSAKPSTDAKPGEPAGDPQNNPADEAGAAKPNQDPARGKDRTPPRPKGAAPKEDQPKEDLNAGGAKPEKATESAAAKPAPKDGVKDGKRPGDAEEKVPPKDPMTGQPGGGASEPKPAPPEPKEGPGAGGEDKSVPKGVDKPDPKNDAAKPQGGAADPKGKKEQGKLTEKERKELEGAARDLTSPDPKKREAAQKKLDEAVGQKNREELEQLAKDLQSPDKDKREAAEKKLKDLQEKAEEQAKKDGLGKGDDPKQPEKATKGKELTQEELAELAKKANDLNSKDEDRRKDAEKALDDKFGKEAREKLQEEMNNQPKDPADPKGQEELRKRIEEIAKNPPGRGKTPEDWKSGGGSSDDELKPAAEADPRHRARTAQLQLEDFEKNRYNKDLHDKLGWTQDEYRKFLEAEARRVDQLRKEADDAKEVARRKVQQAQAGQPSLKAGGATKVEAGTGSGPTTTSGAAVAPAGFDEAKRRFQEELRKLQPKR